MVTGAPRPPTACRAKQRRVFPIPERNLRAFFHPTRLGQRFDGRCLPFMGVIFEHVPMLHSMIMKSSPQSRSNPRSAPAVVRDVTRDLGRWRRDRGTSENTYLAARYLHILTNGRSSALALSALRTLPGSPERLSNDGRELNHQLQSALATLRRDGITELPRPLDASDIAGLVAFARTAPAVLSDTQRRQSRGTYEDRPPGTKSVRMVEPFVLNNPIVQGLIANSDLMALAEHYFQTRVLVHPPQLYWSCAPASADAQHDNTPTAQGAEEFHWDFDGLGGLRLHIYLTDVDEGSAPMKYMRASHKPGTLRGWRLRNADRGAADSDVWKRFTPADSMTITGSAGTAFMSNSHGLHRGTPALTRDRLFLVMPFQATGFAGYQLKPRAVVPKHPEFARLLASDAAALRWFRSTPAENLLPAT